MLPWTSFLMTLHQEVERGCSGRVPTAQPGRSTVTQHLHSVAPKDVHLAVPFVLVRRLAGATRCLSSNKCIQLCVSLPMSRHLVVPVYDQHACQLDLLSVPAGALAVISCCTALEGDAATSLGQLDLKQHHTGNGLLWPCCITGRLHACPM